MLKLHEHLAPEVREKFGEAYARKLAPSYRMPRNSGRVAHSKPLSVLDACGPCIEEKWHMIGKRGQRGVERTRKAWPFAGWTHDQAQADKLAAYMLTARGRIEYSSHAETLARLVRITPAHTAHNAAHPTEEYHATCE